MKAALCLAAVLALSAASPSGYYHQEYNYKTSSSAYKNNELQHKTDDQGYYAKQGDLEGRLKPKVSSNSEHSEYINPKLASGQASAGYHDSSADFSSHGNMLANSYGASVGGQVATGYGTGSQYEHNLDSEGMASSDYIRGFSGSGNSYNYGSESSSYEAANLRSVASLLQDDLRQELQSALMTQAHQADIAQLEAELRRNLTERLDDILRQKFGTQTIRGGQAYSLVSGRLQTRPNYQQQALQQLQNNIEQSLLSELRQQYHSTSGHSRQHIVNNQHLEMFESTTTYRPSTYRPIYPSLNTLPQEKYPGYGIANKDSHYSQYNQETHSVSSQMQYSQAPNVVSITTIASNVQRDLNDQLNMLLEQAQRQYFAENSHYTAYSVAPILEKMKQELRQNLTYALDQEIRRNFGTQFQRNGYMFSVGSNGESGNLYNYNVADLENLKRQVEDNLMQKLTRDFESAKQHWVERQQRTQSQHSQHMSYGERETVYNTVHDYSSPRYPVEYSTPRYPVEYPTPARIYHDLDSEYSRPTAPSIVPLISSGVKGYQYGAGSSHSNYQAFSAGSNMETLQRQLEAELGHQLEAALSQNKAYASRYASGGVDRMSFDEQYRRLYEELQRNLTQELQHVVAGAGSSAYSSSYGGVSENQLAQLRSHLQQNLASQLQQGLRQSYSASASYSASSSSSAGAAGAYSSSGSGQYNRDTRGSNNYQYGQYKSGNGYYMDDDCQGDDPSVHETHRAKRSYGYRSRPLGLSSNTGVGYSRGM